ncbi:MAG: 16S rRNA (guanine(527)-N(7))-methyltransferase RsmG [Malacoplasma sp.]|nr:16S rRNA (guanine(527)-N(7))-methyltransferase RsmG [Malacoplasma sp.]
MNLDNLIDLLKQKFVSIDIAKVKADILIYKNFLQQENQKFNLTNLCDEKDVYQKYFYESVINYHSSDFEKQNLNLLDIGSGSGIPGVLLKILFPDINLYIVEPNNKKTQFLTQLIKLLNFKNCFIENKRCETYIKDKVEFFDIVTCRAVAELRILLELSYSGLKIGGKAIFLKSHNFKNEINNAFQICNLLQIENKPDVEKVVYENKTFVRLTYPKNKSVSNKFPRNWKQILDNDKN